MKDRERDEDEDEIDTLLARGRLGGPARDRIAHRVVDATARRRWPAYAASSALAFAAAALFVMRPHEDLRAKGGDAGPSVDVVCTTGPLHRCPRGGTLAFRIEGIDEPLFVEAWAERDGAERTWFFTGPDAIRVEPRAAVQTLGRGVVVEGEPGPRRIHVVLSRQPLEGARLVEAREVVARSVVEIEVTP